MAFDSHIVTVRRLKKYIDDVIGKKANLPNNKNTIVGNLGTLNTNVTNITKELNSVSNKVNNLEPVVDSALIYRGKIKNNNVVYGAYDSGIYTISGSEDGIPLQGYGGFMTTYRESATSILIKHLILQNAYQFVMAQKVDDGTVTLSWVRTYPAG
jgi:hypothetical protein